MARPASSAAMRPFSIDNAPSWLYVPPRPLTADVVGEFRVFSGRARVWGCCASACRHAKAPPYSTAIPRARQRARQPARRALPNGDAEQQNPHEISDVPIFVRGYPQAHPPFRWRSRRVRARPDGRAQRRPVSHRQLPNTMRSRIRTPEMRDSEATAENVNAK
jgi:hypothetical protein